MRSFLTVADSVAVLNHLEFTQDRCLIGAIWLWHSAAETYRMTPPMDWHGRRKGSRTLYIVTND
jgi:hypothetical protein